MTSNSGPHVYHTIDKCIVGYKSEPKNNVRLFFRKFCRCEQRKSVSKGAQTMYRNLDEIKKWRERNVQTIYVDYDVVLSFFALLLLLRGEARRNAADHMVCFALRCSVLPLPANQFIMMQEWIVKRKTHKNSKMPEHQGPGRDEREQRWCWTCFYFIFIVIYPLRFCIRLFCQKARIQFTFHIIYKHNAGILLL